jgi:hypothetical protein
VVRRRDSPHPFFYVYLREKSFDKLQHLLRELANCFDERLDLVPKADVLPVPMIDLRLRVTEFRVEVGYTLIKRGDFTIVLLGAFVVEMLVMQSTVSVSDTRLSHPIEDCV